MVGHKRGQAAIEYLISYGWILIVLLISIAALSYFGIIDTSKWLPNHFTLDSGFSPKEYKIDEGSLRFTVTNNLGDDAEILAVKVTATSGGESICNASRTLDSYLKNGGSSSFTFAECKGTAGNRFKANVEFIYRTQGTVVNHTINGNLVSKVEKGADSWDSFCGDGNCDAGEDISSCPADCKPVCGDGTCDVGEDSSSCPADCGPVCGDGNCDAGESSSSCPTDCGEGCVPDCAGKNCGSDGCGGSCGSCVGQLPACMSGQKFGCVGGVCQCSGGLGGGGLGGGGLGGGGLGGGGLGGGGLGGGGLRR